MKVFVGLVLLIAGWSVDPGDIGKVNAAKKEAREAYMAGDFKKAAEVYGYLVDSVHVNEEEVMLNLANSLFKLNDSSRAMSTYQPLTMSANKQVKSLANQQLGVMNNRQGKMEEALQFFKQSIKADPTNDDARFNYEMVKKKLDDKKKQEEQKKDKSQDKKDQQDKEKQESKEPNKDDKKDPKDKDKNEPSDKDQKPEKEDPKKQDPEKSKDQDSEQKEKEEKDQLPPSVKDKLKDMDISEEKAKMILEAMKNQEVQYLQQNKRKPSKQRDKTKPDW